MSLPPSGPLRQFFDWFFAVIRSVAGFLFSIGLDPDDPTYTTIGALIVCSVFLTIIVRGLFNEIR